VGRRSTYQPLAVVSKPAARLAIDLPLEPLTCLAYDMGVNDLPGPQLMTQTFVRVCFAAIRGDRQDRLRTWIDEQRGSLLTAGL
jgi:hypothetical protein